MSLLDNINEQLEDKEIELQDWLNRTCKFNGLTPVLRKGTNIVDMVFEDFILLDVDDSWVQINKNIKNIPKNFKFGRIEGSLVCKYCDLNDCSGFPNEIYRGLYMKYCQNIEEIPHFDRLGSFHCRELLNLVKINKFPNHIGGIIDFYYCPKITLLNWAPENIGGNVWMDSQYKNEYNKKFLKERMSEYSDLYWQ